MFDVATIQTQLNSFEEKVIIAPRRDNSIDLDACPKGTIEVRSFPTARAAAKHMQVHVKTVYAGLARFREFQAGNRDTF